MLRNPVGKFRSHSLNDAAEEDGETQAADNYDSGAEADGDAHGAESITLSASFFRSLLPETWARISAHLSAADLMHCELVSRRFSALVKSLWQSTKFASFEVTELFSFDASAEGDAKRGKYFRYFRCLLSRIGETVDALSFTVPRGCASDEKFTSTEILLEVYLKAPHLKGLHLNRVSLLPETLHLLPNFVALESLSLKDICFLNAKPSSFGKGGRYQVCLSDAVAPLVQLKELRLVFSGDRQACSIFFLDWVPLPSLRVLEIRSVLGGWLATLRAFIRSHHELEELSVTGYIRLTGLPDNGPSIMRSLVECCPNLKRVDLFGLGAQILDDIRLLHDLESLVIEPMRDANLDGDVIEVCERNPALTKFDIVSDRWNAISERAYTQGFARLAHLQSINIGRFVRLDDHGFEKLTRANSLSLRELVVRDPSGFSIAALGSLGFHCLLLEKLSFGLFDGASYPWYSVAALRKFAEAVAASCEQSMKKRKVRILVNGLRPGDELKPPVEMPVTGLVAVEFRAGLDGEEEFQY